VALQLALFFGFLAAGLACQVAGAGDRIRERAWVANFWILTPLVVFVTFSRIHLHEQLVLALVASIVAGWLVIAASYAYAFLVADAGDERGALVLGASFGNTGFLGYPLAQLAYGHPGFALAVLYDRIGLLFPPTSISTAMARLHGLRKVDVVSDSRLRAIVLNPPAWALVLAVGLRLAGVHVPTTRLNDALAFVVGPFGFLLLGLALPLERIEHRGGEVARAVGSMAIRCGLSPLLLFACGHALGAHIPGAFYLVSAMPAAFHLLVLARVYDLRPALMRLIVVGSTVPAVIAVAIGVALTRS
jgi:predicted permease